MSVSKNFNEAMKNISCRQYVHPTQSCTQHFLYSILNYHDAVIKYYFPMYLIPVLFKYKSWTKEMLLREFKNYLQCVAASGFLGGFTFPIACVFYKILGRFHIQTAVFLPLFIASIGTGYTMPSKMKAIQAQQLFNTVLTVWIKKSKCGMVKIFRNSKSLATLLFMFSSMGIMYGFKTTHITRLWFASPAQTNSDNLDNHCDNKICKHPGNCKNYIKEKMKKSLGFTVLLGLTRAISAFKEIRNPIKFITALLKKFDYGFASFILSYAGIFYVLNCWLNNKTKEDSLENCLIAGFFSGLSYIIFPKYFMFTYGVTTAFLNTWNSLISANKNKPKWLERFDDLPFSRIFYIFSSSLAFYYRFVIPYYTPVVLHKVMALVTKDRSEVVAENIANILLGYGPITDQFKKYYF